MYKITFTKQQWLSIEKRAREHYNGVSYVTEQMIISYIDWATKTAQKQTLKAKELSDELVIDKQDDIAEELDTEDEALKDGYEANDVDVREFL